MALPDYLLENGEKVIDPVGAPLLDFDGWLVHESAQIDRIVSDGANVLRSIPRKKKMKFSFIALTEDQRDAIGPVNALVNEWIVAVGYDEHRVPKYPDVNDALHSELRPTTLITAAWINALLMDDKFKTSTLWKRLNDVGLGNGLPDNSVVPSLRIASPLFLNRLFSEVSVSNKKLDSAFDGFPIPGSELVHDLRTMDNLGKNVEESAHRITTFTAQRFHQCMVELFSKTNKDAVVPELDVLFPLAVNWTYKRKRKGRNARRVRYDLAVHKIRNPVLHPDDGNLLSL